MYSSYAGKLRTDSNIAWHRPQSTSCRVDEELMQKSARALVGATDPLDKLRLLCLSRGASGIMGLGRYGDMSPQYSARRSHRPADKLRLLCLSRGASCIIGLGRNFRRIYEDGRKHLTKEEFFERIKETGLDISDEDTDALFAKFDTEDSDTISVDEFIKQLRPPMSDRRRALVEQAFRKVGKSGGGVVDIDDLRAVYSVSANPRYKSGEETADVIMDKFLANFETEGIVDGKVTLEEFMNYYSAISVSIEEDSFFDLMMRQAYKL